MQVTRRTRFLFAFLAPALSFALAACGGADDADDAGTTGAGPTTTTADVVARGSGNGTFVVGDRTFAFEAEPCRVEEPDEGETLGTIDAGGKGTFDNRPFTITVKASASERSLIETVQIVFSIAESVVGTNFAVLPHGADDAALEVSGDGEATGTMPVLGTGGQPSGDGRLTLRCDG